MADSNKKNNKKTKKAYRTMELTVYGHLAEITKGNKNDTNDMPESGGNPPEVRSA
jgi:hypothetical protein